MKKVILFLAAAALLAVGCNKEASVATGDGTPVKFSAALKYHFDTRATATEFVENDHIGIFAGAPIARYNIQGTVGSNGTSVTPASPINWQAGQTAATTFAAYYPYSSEKTPASSSATPMVIEWTVEANQSSPADLDISDLRIAKDADVAVNTPVSLGFKHAFARIDVTVTNNLSSAVSKVEVLGTYRTGSVDLVAQSVTTSGSTSAITTYHESASSPYEAIILPQTASPSICVTVAGGTTYTFTMDGSAMAFEGGKIYSCAIQLNPGSAEQHAASFSVSGITDWAHAASADNPTYTGDPSVASGEVWSVIGTINGSSWNEDFPMTQTATGTNPEDGTWEATITIADGADGDNTGDEFKLRWAGDWGSAANGNVVAVGGDPSWWFYDGTNLQGWQANAGNIKCKEAGTYKVTLYYPSCKLDVVKQ